MRRFGLDLSKVSRLGGHSFERTHRGGAQFPGMTITVSSSPCPLRGAQAYDDGPSSTLRWRRLRTSPRRSPDAFRSSRRPPRPSSSRTATP